MFASSMWWSGRYTWLTVCLVHVMARTVHVTHSLPRPCDGQDGTCDSQFASSMWWSGRHTWLTVCLVHVMVRTVHVIHSLPPPCDGQDGTCDSQFASLMWWSGRHMWLTVCLIHVVVGTVWPTIAPVKSVHPGTVAAEHEVAWWVTNWHCRVGLN